MAGGGVEIDVVADDIRRLAQAVRKMSADRAIVNNMARRIRSSVPPVRREIRSNAMSYLPSRGGLNAWVARVSVNARVRRSLSNAGISFAIGRNSDRRRTDTKRLDAGRLRAPLFGDRRSWHLQSVKANFASDAVESVAAKDFRNEVVLAVDQAVREALG